MFPYDPTISLAVNIKFYYLHTMRSALFKLTFMNWFLDLRQIPVDQYAKV